MEHGISFARINLFLVTQPNIVESTLLTETPALCLNSRDLISP